MQSSSFLTRISGIFTRNTIMTKSLRMSNSVDDNTVGDGTLMVFQFQYEHLDGTIATDTLFDLVEKMKVPKGDTYLLFCSNWCPDCRSVPDIVIGLQQAGDIRKRDATLFVVDVGEAYLWRTGENRFKHPPLSIPSIPTVVRLGKGNQEINRISKGISAKEGIIKDVIIDFVKRSD